MTQIQQQFFALLRAGLWGKAPDAALFGAGTDWPALLAASKKQSVQAVVLDGVQMLPPDCRPPKALYLQWCALGLHTEEQNELLNHELGNLYALMRAHGIEPVLVKGQAVAQCYRHPEHRRCGDIDFYIGPEDYERANALLRPEATHEEEEIFKHACMHWHGVIVENHRILISLSRPVADRRMQRLTASWGRDKSACPTLRVGETEARVPSVAFHTAYVLTHATLHFLNEGIGMRQVCDWACLLHAHHSDEELREVARLIRSFGLTRAARLFGALLMKQLDFPAEWLPIPCSPKDFAKADWLLQDIWTGGNFGVGQHRQRPRGYWAGKWYTLRRVVKRCVQMGALAPGEAFWYPIMVAVHSVQMQVKMRMKG